MAETVLETAVCSACGVDVRDQSVFCYNCGERVKEDSTGGDRIPEAEAIVPKPESRPPLKSAASLRKQRRAYNRQPLEISWERPNGSPIWFTITTIVLGVGSLVLLLLALYLR